MICKMWKIKQYMLKYSYNNESDQVLKIEFSIRIWM